MGSTPKETSGVDVRKDSTEEEMCTWRLRVRRSLVRRRGRVCLKMRKARVVGTQKGGRKGETGNMADSGVLSTQERAANE